MLRQALLERWIFFHLPDAEDCLASHMSHTRSHYRGSKLLRNLFVLTLRSVQVMVFPENVWKQLERYIIFLAPQWRPFWLNFGALKASNAFSEAAAKTSPLSKLVRGKTNFSVEFVSFAPTRTGEIGRLATRSKQRSPECQLVNYSLAAGRLHRSTGPLWTPLMRPRYFLTSSSW